MYTKTIASIASGMGGGIGVIRISGDDALTVAGKIFRKRSQIDLTSECEKDGIQYDDKYFWKKESHTIHYGFIVDNGKVIDEVMVLLMKKPNSYTREDVKKRSCLGGAGRVYEKSFFEWKNRPCTGRSRYETYIF